MALADYVGLPFVDVGRDPAIDGGLDCWGLIRWCFKQERGLLLPRYDSYEDSWHDRGQIAGLIDAGLAEKGWRVLAATEAERMWDIAVFRIAGAPLHGGLVIEPGRMLHTTEATGAVVESYRAPRWRARLLALYRHD